TILCATLMVAGTWYVLSPTTLRIALPPGGEAGVMRVLAERLDRRATDVRLQPGEVAGICASAEAMRAGKVDLAVVQPDVLYPGNGGTVAILRQEAIILLSRTHEKAVSQLNGKQVAVLTNRTSDAELIRQILAHYQVTAANVTVLAPNGAVLAPSGAVAPNGAGLAPNSVAPAPNGSETAPAAAGIDAVFLVATPGTEDAQRLLRIASALLGNGAAIVPLRAADIIARTLPDLSEMTLPPNALGSLPDEEVKTMGVSYRLVA